jgi:ATP-binding cassette subfamily C protein LapB
MSEPTVIRFVGAAAGSRGGRTDPLLECLLALAAHHGRPTSRDAVLAGLPLDGGSLTPAIFPRAAARAGLACSIVETGLDQIADAAFPLVLVCQDNEACVMLGWAQDGRQARLILPQLQGGEVLTPREKLAQRYGGYAIAVRPEYQFDERSDTGRPPQPKHWFWGTVLEHVPAYRDVLWAALLINVLALGLPLFTMNVYDRVVPNRAIETLWMLSIGVAIVLVFDVALRTVRSHYLDVAGRRIDLRLSARIMERVLDTRLSHRPVSVGSFAANLRSFESVREFVTSTTMTTFVDLPFALLFLLIIGWIAPLMVLPVVFGIAAVVLYVVPVQAKMSELTETSARAAAQRNATLVEGLSRLEIVKALGIEGWMQARWEQAAEFLAATGTRLRGLGTSAINAAAWTQQMVTASLVVLGVYLIAGNQLTLGGLIACTMLAGRAMGPLGQVATLMTQFHGARTALGTLDAIMAQPVERPAGERFVQRQRFQGAIEFRDVDFQYPGQGSDALKEVSFKVAPGERVALLGLIGSGKSTVLRLVMGLYQPTGGAVLIDGIDQRQIDPAELRRNIGYVPQEPSLLYGTLRDNIAFGGVHPTDAQIIRAASTAELTDFVNRHPKGFDMPVGERGEALSGGQKKSVALARAVVEDRPILLLDEPTDSMDHTTEERVRQRLKEFSRDKTLLLITHRNALLDLIDAVIVFDQGRVVAAGPRDAVLSSLKSGAIRRGA